MKYRIPKNIADSFDSDKKFVKFLIAEADTHINNIKRAFLIKEAMAAHSTRELKNSTSNTIWKIPNKSARIKKIEKELEAGFAPYVKQLAQKIKQPGTPNIRGFLSGEKGVNLSTEDGSSTLRMEFEFFRQVVPVSGKASENAEKNIQMIDDIVPGFSDFINAINEHKVPLVPGYGTNLGEGRPDQDSVKKFIEKESSKTGFIPSSSGDINRSSFWKDHVKRIQSGLKSAFPKMTYQRINDRLFEPKEAFSITYPSYLLRAIQAKIMQGFRLNEQLLHEAIKDSVHKIISKGSEKKDLSLYIDILKKWVEDLKSKIVREYKKAMSPYSEQDSKMTVQKFKEGKWVSEEIPVHTMDWGTDFKDGMPIKYRGLRTNVPAESKKTTKNLYCLDLNNSELQFMLYALSDNTGVRRISFDKNVPVIPDEGFVIPDFSLTYSANGFDSDPSQAVPGMIGPQMLVLPPIVQVPQHLTEQYGQTAYNTDHGNLGRNILVGRKSSENIVNFLSDPRVGQFAVNALKHLQQPSVGQRRTGVSFGANVQSLYDEAKGKKSSGAYEAWSKYIGTTNKTNRTSAEALQENILYSPEGNKRSKQELAEFLKFSWSAEISKGQISIWANKLLSRRDKLERLQSGRQVIGFLETVRRDPNAFDKTEAQSLINLLKTDPNISSLDDDKKRDYQDLLKNVLSKGGRSSQSADYVEVSDEMYELLHKYGYAVAKMMDFVHALMVRSCEERLIRKLSPAAAKKEIEKYKKRAEEAGGTFDESDIPDVNDDINREIHHFSYGRTYASTTGKNQKGTIVFGLKYAFNAPEFNPDDKVFKDIYTKAREQTRSRGKGTGLFSPHEGQDPAMGRRTSNPQKGSELPEIFQPQGSGVIRIVEDMTFWFGSKSSEKGRAKTQRGQNRELGFDTKIVESYSYEDALALLKSQYPAIENDLDIIYSPISISVADIKRAADKAISLMKEQLNQIGVNVDVAITDSLNRVRLASSTADIEASKEIEEVVQNNPNKDNIRNQRDDTPEINKNYTVKYPEEHPEINPGIQDTEQQIPRSSPLTQTDTPVQLQEPIPSDTQNAEILDERFDFNLPEEMEDETKAMPMSPLMHDDPFGNQIRKRNGKGKRSLIRENADPKIRRASTEDVLIKLADKLDSQGQYDITNKIDRLLKIIREQNHAY